MLIARICLLLIVMVIAACDHPTAPIVDASPAPAVKPKDVYEVSKGDTLYSIAFIANKEVTEIARLNNISEPYTIYVGQKIALNSSALAYTQPTATSPAVPNVGASDSSPPTNAPTSQPSPKTEAPVKASPPPQPVAATPKRTEPIPKPSAKNAKSDVGWIWPVDGKIITNYSNASKGIDIAGKSGTPIAASRSGVVVYTGNAIRGSGNMVIIKHDDRYLSAYAHLKEIKVEEGQQVRQSDTIGTLGRSDATSDRLHFEVRDKGKPVNPLNFLKS